MTFWKALHEHLRGNGYIQSNEYGACFLTERGKKALSGDDPVVLPEIIVEVTHRPKKMPLEQAIAVEAGGTADVCGSDESGGKRRCLQLAGTLTRDVDVRNAGSKWTAEEDDCLWRLLGGFPLTASGSLPSNATTQQIVSELAFKYGRTKGAIQSRLRHMNSPSHKACRTVSNDILGDVTR